MAKEKEITIDLAADPNPLPKVGDTINRVLPHNHKIVQAKVIAVDETGRMVKIEIIEGEGDNAKKKIISLPHRQKEALAGNTWHWGKAVAMVIALACLAIAYVARAGLPSYHTTSAAGSGATVPATAFFAADPNAQIRIVSLFYTNDNVAGTFTFSSGGTAWACQETNLSTFTTNAVGSTNGMYGGEQVILQHLGICYTNAISTFGWNTNTTGNLTTNGFFYVNTASAFGVSPSVGDNIWQMTNSLTWRAGATAGAIGAINGDDIYSGNYGAPVEVQLVPATVADQITSMGAHYDSQSQP